jgi:hypothetical protein
MKQVADDVGITCPAQRAPSLFQQAVDGLSRLIFVGMQPGQSQQLSRAANLDPRLVNRFLVAVADARQMLRDLLERLRERR